jgi:DNA polymerase-1
MPVEQAALFRKRFFETYRGIYAWHQRIKSSSAPEGRTLTGRRFPFRPEAGLPERSNLPVQGTAADIIKKALGLLVRRLDPEIWIVAAVHDEILLECPTGRAREAAAVLRSAMEEAADAILPDVPTTVEAAVSASWAEK